MDSFFIEPASLPGGKVWRDACYAATAKSFDPEQIVSNTSIIAKSRASENSQASDLVSEALSCDASSFSGFVQVLMLLFVYGGILYTASQLIANGSELLLLVPSLRKIVGSVVLPILGAVPDGAIVLFSGLGSNAQEELSVGVGALAGSTIMLLTIPWFLSILAGRVNIRADGILTYNRHPHKLIPPTNMNPFHTGVQPREMVQISGKTMLITAFSYLVIQGAALRTGTFFAASTTPEATAKAAAAEKGPAVFCFIVCVIFFFGYLYYQVYGVSEEEEELRDSIVDEVKQKAIRKGEISLSAAFKEIWSVAAAADESTGLREAQHAEERLAIVLKTFFSAYDHDRSGSIDTLELQNLMRDLGEVLSVEDVKQLHDDMDVDSNGKIELEEFIENMPRFIISRSTKRNNSADGIEGMEEGNLSGGFEIENDQEEEEEEVPHDLRHDDPDTQIKNVMRRSFTMMFVGTALVLVFSDPMVGVMSEVGKRIGVPAFYISFVLAPLASNASEFIAAYSYASKKTRKTVTISFSTLLGAAIMNNTFVLAIFMLLLTMKNLAWQFTAETIAILVVELAMGLMSQKKVMTLRDGYIVLSLFPLSIFLVMFLENVVGLD